jgi:hypothetical protein
MTWNRRWQRNDENIEKLKEKEKREGRKKRRLKEKKRLRSKDFFN